MQWRTAWRRLVWLIWMASGPAIMALIEWLAIGVAVLLTALYMFLAFAGGPDYGNSPLWPGVYLAQAVIIGVCTALGLFAVVYLSQRFLAMPRLIWVTMCVTLAGAWAGLTGPPFFWVLYAPDPPSALIAVTVGAAAACAAVLLIDRADLRPSAKCPPPSDWVDDVVRC